MSAFGNWWISFRDAFEKDTMAVITALEPAAKAVAISAVEAGVAAATSKDGTAGDKFVAGRNAVESVVAAGGQAIATDALHAAVALITSAPATPATPQ